MCDSPSFSFLKVLISFPVTESFLGCITVFCLYLKINVEFIVETLLKIVFIHLSTIDISRLFVQDHISRLLAILQYIAIPPPGARHFPLKLPPFPCRKLPYMEN